MTATWFSAPAPVARRVRAFFAPVNRAAQTPVLFDPSEQGRFSFDAPPAPWLSLGWVQNFARKTASKSTPLMTGIPAAALEQVRETLEAEVSLRVSKLDEVDDGAGDGLATYEHSGACDWRRAGSGRSTGRARGDAANRLDEHIDRAGDRRRGKVHARRDRRRRRGLHRADGLCGIAGGGRVRAPGAHGCGLCAACNVQRRTGVAGERELD